MSWRERIRRNLDRPRLQAEAAQAKEDRLEQERLERAHIRLAEAVTFLQKYRVAELLGEVRDEVWEAGEVVGPDLITSKSDLRDIKSRSYSRSGMSIHKTYEPDFAVEYRLQYNFKTAKQIMRSSGSYHFSKMSPGQSSSGPAILHHLEQVNAETSTSVGVLYVSMGYPTVHRDVPFLYCRSGAVSLADFQDISYLDAADILRTVSGIEPRLDPLDWPLFKVREEQIPEHPRDGYIKKRNVLSTDPGLVFEYFLLKDGMARLEQFRLPADLKLEADIRLGYLNEPGTLSPRDFNSEVRAARQRMGRIAT